MKTKNKNVIKIKVDPTSIPNKMHLDALTRFPARIQEDKRFKKPKHKNKDIDW
jgi:hypothetical protein